MRKKKEEKMREKNEEKKKEKKREKKKRKNTCVFLAKSAWASSFNADHVRFTSSKAHEKFTPLKKCSFKRRRRRRNLRMYLRWGLCTLYLLACLVITVGDSGLCCCTCVTYFER